MQKIIHKQNDTLRHIIQKSVQLKSLNQKVQQLLSPELARHCQVANFKEGCLVIQVDSATWCVYLEYQKADLLRQLHALHLSDINQIKFSVALPAPDKSTSSSLVERPALSTETLGLIDATADNQRDPKLKKALHQLALHLKEFYALKSN